MENLAHAKTEFDRYHALGEAAKSQPGCSSKRADCTPVLVQALLAGGH